MASRVRDDKVQVKHLLKADAFGQIVTVYNDQNTREKKLVEDVNDFFSHIYQEADGNIMINEMQQKYNIDEWLKINDIFDNEQNCLLFFIEGYAGCGKSTLVQHILYTILDNENYEYSYYNYDIGIFPHDENSNRNNFIKSSIENGLKKQIIDILQKDIGKYIFENFIQLMNDDDSIERIDKSLNIAKNFGRCKSFLTAAYEIMQNNNRKNLLILKGTIEEKLDKLDIYQLLCIDYLWRLAQYLYNPQVYRKFMYVCYDNLDSITNFDDLCDFKDKLISFRRNLDNYIYYLNERKLYLFENRKEINSFIIFSTYRKITAIRSSEYHTEMIDDMANDTQYIKTLEVSKQYNFMKIADRRIKYFTSKLKTVDICNNSDILIKQMNDVKELKKMVFVKNTYSGLWNNNLRSCSNVLNDLIVKNSFDIKNCIRLSKEKYDGHIPERNCYYGASSLFIHAVCKLLKKIGIFDSKHLDLINTIEDAQRHKTSLSRLLITYIYTSDKSVPITELFFKFDKVFDPRYICKIIGQLLTRVEGEIWRRPIYYSKHALVNEIDIADKLYDQYLKYKKGEPYNKFVEFKICDCGKTYIDAIVPHFEFYSIRINDNFQCIYCVNDLLELTDVLKNVYNKVKECCKKQIEFYESYIFAYGLDNNQYVEQKFHPNTRLGNIQLHIERVIFSHVAYLNNYRAYLNIYQKAKYKEFNETLVNYIDIYLELYDIYVKQISSSREKIAFDMNIKVFKSKNSDKFISIEAEKKYYF